MKLMSLAPRFPKGSKVRASVRPSQAAFAAAAVVALLATIGAPVAAQSPPGVQALEPKLREIFTLWDTDGNGVVSGSEYNRLGGGPSHYDLSKDGVLTPEEYARYHSPAAKTQAPAGQVANRPASASPSPGRYVCTGYGLNAGGGHGFVYKGEFTLLPRGRYSANRTKGRFAVAGRTIRFSGGAYDGISGEIKSKKGEGEIVLTWPPVRGTRSSAQYCNRAS